MLPSSVGRVTFLSRQSPTSATFFRRFVPVFPTVSSQSTCSSSCSSFAICSRRFQSSSTVEDFLAAIDQRLDALERVVSNLVANASESQTAAATNTAAASPSSILSSLSSSAAAPTNNSSVQRNVVAPSTMRSVIKVYSTIVAPNAIQPWQVKNLTTATGTAFIVDRQRKLLLTNAHVVAYASLIEVRRHSQARRCVAECKFISGDCDLALLEVVDETFWDSPLSTNNSTSNNNILNNSNNNNNNVPPALEGPEFFSGLCLQEDADDVRPPSLENIAEIKEFEGFPSLQQSVNVVGFPLGGDQISITSGVVSRIDQTPYSTSGLRIAAIQIDAAINPGNSGGPALCDGKVVGVAFQSLIQAEGIGYIIPNCVVAHFVRSYLTLNGLSKNYGSNNDNNNNNEEGNSSSLLPPSSSSYRGRYHEGFPSVGLYYQELGNPTLRDHFSLPTEANGFLVEKLIGGSPNADKLQAGDIIMKVDGKQIERDITIEWRPNERIQFTHLIHMRNPGEKMVFSVWRGKEETDVEVTLKVSRPLVRPHLLHPSLAQKPPYVMFGGCVFTILSVPYLEAWGNNWPTNAPRALVNNFLFGEISEERTEVVVLAQILPHAVNRGYSTDSFAHRTVGQVGGKSVKNFDEFTQLLGEAAKNESENHVQLTIMDSSYPLTMVLPRKESNEADLILTQQHGIPPSCLVATQK